MKPRIVERGAFHVVGVRERFEKSDIRGIPEVWRRFLSRSGEIEGVVRGAHYGVCVEGPSGTGFFYTACAEVTSPGRVPDGMSGMTVPAGTYAVFTHKGPIAQFEATVRRVWDEWLPASGLEPTGAPDFELYDERFVMESPDSEVDIYVPVQAGTPDRPAEGPRLNGTS